jgi:hypothetical protein
MDMMGRLVRERYGRFILNSPENKREDRTYVQMGRQGAKQQAPDTRPDARTIRESVTIQPS